MIKLLNKLELTRKNVFFFLSLCILIASFPLSIAINSISIGLIFFFFLIDYRNLRGYLKLYIADQRNLILLGLFTSLLISLTYTQNIDRGITKIIAYLPIIVLPLSLIKMQTLPHTQITFLKRLHILVCVMASLYCLIRATFDSGLIDGSYVEKVAPELYPAYFVHRFSYHELSQKVRLHAVHFSFFIAIAMFLTILEFRSKQLRRNMLLALLLLYLGFLLFLLKSAVINFAFYSFILLYCYFSFSFKKWPDHLIFYTLTLFSSLVVTYHWVLKYVGNFANNAYIFNDPFLNKRFLMIAAGLLAFSVVAVVIKVYFNKRYLAILACLIALLLISVLVVVDQKQEGQLYAGREWSGGVNNIIARSGNWQGALKVICEHPITGVGLGDEVNALTEKYKSINFTAGVLQKFNAHNQYLEFWITGGFLAFVCFVLLLISESHKAIYSGNLALLCLIYIFSIFCLTESVLSRHDGKIFFIFFMCLLGVGRKKPAGRAF